MQRETRTIQVDVEVYVSRCEICGEEELANSNVFQREEPFAIAPGAKPRLIGNSWSFPSHGEISVSNSIAYSSDEKRDWRLCRRHWAFMRGKIAEIVAAERAKIS